jgi:membrane-associated phospholipid phosphatase
MSNPSSGILYWPETRQLKQRLMLAGWFLIYFYALYGGAAYAARFIPWRVMVGFDFELHIPFIPISALIYLSLNLLMMLALFVIREMLRFRKLLLVLVVQTAIAVVFFILLPAENNYPLHTDDPVDIFFTIADTLNLTNNEVPSLHVCFAITLAIVLSHYGRMWHKWFFYLWAAAIALSTMTMHEHNLIDLIGGAALAIPGVWYWRKPAPDRVDQSRNGL